MSNGTSTQICNHVIKVQVNWITKQEAFNPSVYKLASELGGLQTTSFVIQFTSTLPTWLSNLSTSAIANVSPL